MTLFFWQRLWSGTTKQKTNHEIIFVPKALCNMGPGVSMCLSLNYIHSGWSFNSFAYLQCAKIVHICSYPMRVFTESPNDITFLHIIICKPHIRVKWIRSL